MSARPTTSASIIELHERLLGDPGWPDMEGEEHGPILKWIVENHRYNCRLWAEEDLARRTKVSDGEIAANKRRIDAFNQARNDATERVDELLLAALGLVGEAAAHSDAPLSEPESTPRGMRLNSETAGSMVDRLSIVSLKIAAMRAQAQRKDVSEEHRRSSQAKLERLLQQRLDLGRCFDELLDDCRAGRAYFKVYRQFKMYNDPNLNPALVAERAPSAAAE